MTQAVATITGAGLITGDPVTVELEKKPAGSGIVFEINGVEIPAHPDYVVNTQRGVTIGNQGEHISIVEHFLSACAMANHNDLHVKVSGANELPVLDGSAQEWITYLNAEFGEMPAPEATELPCLVYHQDPNYDHVVLSGMPSDELKITYLVDFKHPELQRRWHTWRASKSSLLDDIAPARTFGLVSELPMLQAMGLAKGVTLENTIGLMDDGGYTTTLRFEDEPTRHKILDFIGDLMLCGVPIHSVKAHFVIVCAGHTMHLDFGKKLANVLKPA